MQCQNKEILENLEQCHCQQLNLVIKATVAIVKHAKISEKEISMTARYLNNVRVIVKEGCEEQYLAAVEAWATPDGMSDRYLAKTGERRYCFVGLWESEAKLVAARPFMIEHLNAVRDFLEELSPELGVTDPVSGPVVVHNTK